MQRGPAPALEPAALGVAIGRLRAAVAWAIFRDSLEVAARGLQHVLDSLAEVPLRSMFALGAHGSVPAFEFRVPCWPSRDTTAKQSHNSARKSGQHPKGE